MSNFQERGLRRPRVPGRRKGRSFWVGLLAFGWLSVLAQAQTYTVVHSFTVPGGESSSGLIVGSDGNFYGTTRLGGGKSAGTVFKITSAGVLTTLHAFNDQDGSQPDAGVIQATDGSFYGTAYYGGANSMGVTFKIDSAGNFTLLHSFNGSDGANPSGTLVQGTDGKLYGTTGYGGDSNLGTVFQMTTAGTVTTLHSFDGADGALPYAGLIQGTDGKLYGCAASGGMNGLGTVFRIDTSGTTLSTLHDFAGNDGVGPQANLLQASDGKFYGTTYGGGAHAKGTVFRIDTSGTLATLYSFAGSDGDSPFASLIQATDGKLYGTTLAGGTQDLGTVFRIDTAGTLLTTLHSFAGSEGSEPSANVIQASDGNFYGMARTGGANSEGTFYRMNTSNAVTDLHDFGGASAGYEPDAGVVQGTDGNFYGATYRGGTAGLGMVFKMDSGGNVTVLHNFTGPPDGANPQASLLEGSDGKFYGTTTQGGSNDLGSVFSVTSTGTLTTLHSFNDTDGTDPVSSLMQASDGKFYGTTNAGGANNEGTIFRIDSAGNFSSLHSFAGSEGANPMAGLIQASDGNFYGTTESGGGSFAGNVFKMTPALVVTSLYDFSGGANGSFPFGRVVQGTDGKLYGTTRIDGTGGGGTIFRITTAGALTTLYGFSGSDGSSPQADLIQASDGNFYGTTYAGGTTNNGTIFKIDSTNTLTTLHNLTGFDGNGPAAALVQGSDGALYGTANQGGAGAAGVVFRVAICSPPSPPVAGNNGPICAGQDLHLTASTVAGATYAWTGPNGFTSSLQNPVITAATTAASGTYSVVAIVGGCASSPATTTATVRALPSATITTAGAVCPNSSGHPASVPDAGAGATYSWAITNGTITAGAGTRAITFSTGSTGPLGLSVTVTNSNGCSASSSVSIPFSGCLSFFTLTPCRVIDTRGPTGPLGGPALAAKATRTFAVAGHCGIPSTAKALSVNVTVTQSTAIGDLRLLAGGGSLPLVSTINYGTGQTRANNAVTSLGATGLAIRCDQAAGSTVEVIVDVNGYFQ